MMAVTLNHVLKLLYMRNISLFIKVPLIAKLKLCYDFREYISICELFPSVYEIWHKKS